MTQYETIREALNYAWSYVESHHMQMLGDDNEHAAAQTKADLDRIDAALSALKAMEEQEPVAWMNDQEKRDDAFIFHTPSEPANPFFPIPLYTHPAPSASVDLAGVIEAGDAIIKLWEEELRYDGYDTSTGFREATYTWTSATKPFRKP